MNTLSKFLYSVAIASLAVFTAKAEGEPSKPDCTVTIAPFSIAKDATVQMPVQLDNSSFDAIQMQCDIYLPEGLLTAYNSEGVPESTVCSDRVTNHGMNNKAFEGFNRYTVISLTNSEMNGNSGAVFTIPLTAVGAPGEYTITIKNARVVYRTSDSYAEISCPESTATVTVTEPNRYGENQMYCEDLTTFAGATSVLKIGYNSTSEVYDYSTDVTLPAGVEVVGVEFCDCVNVSKFTNDWSVDDNVLSLSGSEGKKGDSAYSGDNIFALVTVTIPPTMAVGRYDIVVGNQQLTNYDEENDGEYSPASYTAYLTIDNSTGVENCSVDNASTFDVYDINGVLIRAGSCSSSRIALPSKSGVYIVKVGSRTLKYYAH